jgi:DNA modification methylase/DNA-binding Xre family transcriptional regulator
VTRGVSITDLAEQTAVSVSYISKVEKGVFPLTSTLIDKLCAALDCSEADLNDTSHSLPHSFQKPDLTFKSNLLTAIHKWYPYIEGYSAGFVKSLLDNHPPTSMIYDPFNGSGTTMLTAAYSGYKAIASEINPFMRFVASVKVNTVKSVIGSHEKYQCLLTAQSELERFSDTLYPVGCVSGSVNSCFINDGFFSDTALSKIAFIKSYIAGIRDKDVREMLNLSLASILVEISTMVRAADLRRRTSGEQNHGDERAIFLFKEKLSNVIDDIRSVRGTAIEKAEIISDDAKSALPSWNGSVDVVITSPPYINGTNYFRNSKLELWILDFIASPDDLRKYRSKAVTAGINNVSKDIEKPLLFDFVEEYARQLDRLSPDRRIPAMIRSYFSDMDAVFSNLSNILKPGGRLYFDIGDSEYYGVHVPVDEIIGKIACNCGLALQQSLITRNRKSKSGRTLTQRLMIFDRPGENPIYGSVGLFGKELPYKAGDFAKRNWGNAMHSLCSYQGKLKPSIAYHLIQRFTKPGEKVLDPFCGVGTIPLEACLNGRVGIGIDINPIAFANTLAKVKRLDVSSIQAEIEKLEGFMSRHTPTESEIQQAHSKLPINNGRVSEYYHEDTLNEILAARECCKAFSKGNPEQQFILACLLHILHGNRPYALSKRSNNQTPLKPRADEAAVYKNVVEKLREKAMRMIGHFNFDDSFCEGDAHFDSVFTDQIDNGSIDAIITSPPFAGSTRFYSSNWLRLWFCGWGDADFVAEKERFVDFQQEKGFDDVYRKILDRFYAVMKVGGLAIMHLGKTEKIDMMDRIRTLVETDGRFSCVGAAEESVAGCENHGLRDQGATTDHQFLFFRKI